MLPPDYSRILARGVSALTRAEAEFRRLVDSDSAPRDPWHTIRDLHGLIQRLDSADDWQWRTGFARVHFAPSDPALLDEFLQGKAWRSPYRSEGVELFDADDKAAISDTRRFLASYIYGEFEFEDIDPPQRTAADV